jgi:hypothetical protein
MKMFVPAALLLLFSACNSSPSSSLPTTPTTLTTETFAGTVDIGGKDFHKFVVAASGEVDVTLTAAGPPSTIFMGLGVGSLSTDGTACSLITGAYGPFPAGPTPQITGTANAGTFCVEVYDVGNQTAQVSYTVVVAHP